MLSFPTLHLSCSPYLLPKSTQFLHLSSLAYQSHVYNWIASVPDRRGGGLQVYILVSEIFSKNDFSSLSITIIVLDRQSSFKNNQSFLEQSLKKSYWYTTDMPTYKTFIYSSSLTILSYFVTSISSLHSLYISLFLPSFLFLFLIFSTAIRIFSFTVSCKP